MPGWLRFRRFRTRLLVLIVGLVAATQIVTYVVVSRANRLTALDSIDGRLERGVLSFRSIIRQREDDLLLAARMMAGDYAMRSLFLAEQFSAATARSALLSYQERIAAPVVVLLDPAGGLLADSRGETGAADAGLLRKLHGTAVASESEVAKGFGLVGGVLHQFVLVPLLAPAPEVAAWVGIGFPVDQATASRLKENTDLEVTFLLGSPDVAPLATTLPAGLAAALASAGQPDSAAQSGQLLDLAGHPHVTIFRRLDLIGGGSAWIALQRSLEEELEPSRTLQRFILLVALAGLLVALLAASGMARNLSQPVNQLAAHTRNVAGGDYSARIDLRREDELGQLAAAFNHMSAGLAERDRVRDLLGKVVSPEIASQLLQSDLQLGGAEREVTILFSDLRDFTTLSEGMPPTELLGVLNRYLDRMSAAIEKHGGVIDKYIGDAIMALFGAPVSSDDPAGQAMAAAREMDAALLRLNVELAAEGKPELRCGIGINTARVVAGNMGSRSRLNYTVIGDGVNLASRLEGMTKEPSYETHIIVSEATLRAARRPPPSRPLGTVQVKGKSETVAIYALGPKGESQPPYPMGSPPA